MSEPELEPLGGDPLENQYQWMEHRCALLSKELMVEGCAESVLILITVGDPKTSTTNCLSRASGNWYANAGAAREWLEKDRARINKYINNQE